MLAFVWLFVARTQTVSSFEFRVCGEEKESEHCEDLKEETIAKNKYVYTGNIWCLMFGLRFCG